MSKKRKPGIIESIKMGYEAFAYDTGVWMNKLVARLRGEKPAPTHKPEKSVQRISVQRTAVLSEEKNEVVPSVSESDILTAERQDIAQWLGEVKFRTRLFAGVDETDVWKKIGQLNRLYDKALLAERARYDALLQLYREQGTAADEEEYEVEDEHSEEGEQLDSREDNSETSAEGSAEVRISESDGEDSADSAGVLADTDSGVSDNSGEGE